MLKSNEYNIENTVNNKTTGVQTVSNRIAKNDRFEVLNKLLTINNYASLENEQILQNDIENFMRFLKCDKDDCFPLDVTVKNLRAYQINNKVYMINDLGKIEKF